MNIVSKLNAINIRINLLKSRRTACGSIIKKLERKKRVLQAKL